MEHATLEWVHWISHHRLLAPLSYSPLAAYEAQFAFPQVVSVAV